MTTVQTPRKLPFKDATNSKGSELLKSALKSGVSSSRVEKVQKQEPVVPPQQKDSEEVMGFDFSEFAPPSDGDCYCCKENPKKRKKAVVVLRKLSENAFFVVDEENWRKALAYADNFIANLLPDRLDEDFYEPLPPSPIFECCPLTDDEWMKPKPIIAEPIMEPFLEFDSSINGISNVAIDDSASSKPLEVPDFDDLESSLEIPDFCSNDESIILDW